MFVSCKVCEALIISFLALSLMPAALAHIPRAVGENDSIQNAARIDNPAKSWAIYDDIHHGGQAKYYRLELKSGERLYAGVFLARSNGFLPGMAAIGPGFGNEGYIPPFVGVPPGDGFVAVNGTLGVREFEPFTPAAYYQICQLDITVNRTGTYYVVVFETEHAGDFGIAIGYVESFTFDEWLLIPFSVINIHVWEGQSPVLIFAPLVVTVVAVFAAVYWAKRRGSRFPGTVSFSLGTMGAALYLGTAGMTLLQMAMALGASGGFVAGGLVTLIFAIIPIVLGYVIVDKSRSDKMGLRGRALMAALGILGLVFWAGLLAGPILVLVVALSPGKLLERKLGTSE